ncbi:MAG: DUF3613 domain-containing protein [Pseudomonas sp.]
MNIPRSWRLPIAIILILLAGCVQAQQQSRLTGESPQTATVTTTDTVSTSDTAHLPPPTSPFADTVAATSKPPKREIGDATRALLRMQAEGTYAGGALPILGDQASRSYKRYIASFEHAIPEHFEQTVSSTNSK